MVLDIGNYPNFARSPVTAQVGAGDTSISISDASQFDTGTPPYLATVWDTDQGRPDQDGNVELVEVTAVDTGSNTLTVSRGVGQTSDVSHPDTSAVLVPSTANLFGDIDVFLEALGPNSSGTLNELTTNVNNEQTDAGQRNAGTVIDVSASPYNAPKAPNGDATTAVQDAINDLPAEGGTLVFPYLVKVTSTIDATDTVGIEWTTPQGHRGQVATAGISADQGGIRFDTGGSVGLDLVGAAGHRFNCFLGTQDESGSNQASIVMLLGRGSNDISYGHKFDAPMIYGAPTNCLIYNTGKEMTKWFFGALSARGGAAEMKHTTGNIDNVSSPNTTMETTGNTITEWNFFGTRFQRAGTQTTPSNVYEGTVNKWTWVAPFFWENAGDHICHKFERSGGSVGDAFDFYNPVMEGNMSGSWIGDDGSTAAGDIGSINIHGGDWGGDGTEYVMEISGPVFGLDQVTIMNSNKGAFSGNGLRFGRLIKSNIQITADVDIQFENKAVDSFIYIPSGKSTLTENNAHNSTILIGPSGRLSSQSLQIEIYHNGARNAIEAEPGGGLVLTRPDGSAEDRIRLDNNGNAVTDNNV